MVKQDMCKSINHETFSIVQHEETDNTSMKRSR